MNNINTLIVLLLCFAVLTAIQLNADGCYFSEDAVAVSSDQRAVIIKNKDDISITFSTAYTGDGNDFGWLIPTPVPAEPQNVSERGEQGENNFKKLDEYTAPIVITEEVSGNDRGCFPPGTLVHTKTGLRPIENLSPGSEVRVFDFTENRWTYSEISIQKAYQYTGDMITIRSDEIFIEATGNHSFYVTDGKLLEVRAAPSEIPEDEQQRSGPGRWVESRHLQAGDRLMTVDGVELGITELSIRDSTETVYHLEVEKYRNFAVADAGVLVHNGGKQEAASGAEEKAEPLVEVYGIVDLENYEASILGATDVSALYDWLRINKYQVDPDAGNVLQSYIDKNWAFVAVKMHPEKQRSYENEFLSPLTINYRYDELVFPLRISSVSTADTAAITLYVIAESTVTAANIPTSELRFDELAREDIGPEDYIEASILRTLAGQDGGGMVKLWSGELSDNSIADELSDGFVQTDQQLYLTRLETRLAPASMTEDIYLLPEQNAADFNVVFKLLYRYGMQKDRDVMLNNIALRGAAQNGETDAVLFLLDQQAETNSVDDTGQTSLMLAIRNGQLEIADILIDAGARVNIADLRKNTALIFAAAGGSSTLVRNLILAEADVNAANNSERTPVLQAAVNDRTDILELLIDAGTDINRVSGSNGTALIIASRLGNLDTVNILLEAGADVNAYSDNCLTPGGYTSTRYGWTPLYAAVHGNHPVLINLLLEAGADLRKQAKNGATILHMASDYGHSDCIGVLLDAGFEVNARDEDGKTALHIAADKGNTGAIRVLLEYGADPLLENSRGRTALQIAELRKHERTAAVLRNGERSIRSASAPPPGLEIHTGADTERPAAGQWGIDSEGFRRFYTDDPSLIGKWFIYRARGSFQSRMEIVEAKVVRKSGHGGASFGIVFCFINAGNFYKLRINTEGEYKISKYVNGRQTTLINWTESAYLNKGYDVVNRLKIEYLGDSSFEYSFNGNRIGSFVDTSYVGGDSGYYAWISEHDVLPAEPVDLRFMQIQPSNDP